MRDSIHLSILITVIGIYFLILSNQLTRIEQRLIKNQQTTEQTNGIQPVPQPEQVR